MRRVLAAVGAGIAFGIGTVALNQAADGPVRLISSLTGSGIGWALFGVVAGAVAGRGGRPLPAAAGLATVALLAAVLAYYVADSVPADGPLRLIDRQEWAIWSVAALVLGPPLGALGGLSARRRTRTS